MAPSATTSPHAFPVISGYRIVEQLYLGSRTAVYRAIQTATQLPVVIKVLRREYPSFGELVQFRNQYTILRCIADADAKHLPIPGIVQPLSLEPLGSGYALVMEDWGGVALGKYLQQQSLALTDVLAIAVQIADILHDLRQFKSEVHHHLTDPRIPHGESDNLTLFSVAD